MNGIFDIQVEKQKKTLFICISIWIAHIAILSFNLPISELLTNNPLLYVDSPFHQYQSFIAKQLADHHQLMGYDPWFSAGYLGGITFNASGKFPALLTILFSPAISPETAYKLFVFLSGAIAPAFILWTTRILKLNVTSTVAAMILGVLMWWISALRWYHVVGMVSYVTAVYGVVAFIALGWKAVTRPPNIYTTAGLSLFAALGTFYHPLFAIPIVLAVPFLILSAPSSINSKSLLILLISIPVISFLINSFWIISIALHAGVANSHGGQFQRAVDASIILYEALGRIEGNARGARINILLWACTAWAIFMNQDARSRRIAIGFTAAALAIILFAALGAWWPVFVTIQPNRHSAAAYLLLTIPAAIGISASIEAIKQQGLKRTIAIGWTVVLCMAGLFLGREFVNELSSTPTSHYGKPAPEVKGVGDTTAWMINWIRNNTDDDARVLFETSPDRIHDGAHIAGYLAMRTQREFIGGPYIYLNYADFWQGYVFGRPIEQWSANDLAAKFQLYNVGWILTYTPASNAYLQKLPMLEQVAQHGPVTAYRVQQAHSYFAEGSGRVVSRQIDRIDLAEVRGEAITLKYHYVDGLITTPPATIEPVFLDEDPQPFIRILHPADKLSILYP